MGRIRRIRCFAVEMARRGRSGGITNLRFLVRPRRLETRTERGFPHFHSNGGYCSLAHLKRQTLQNRGVRQILAQNRFKAGSSENLFGFSNPALLYSKLAPSLFLRTRPRGGRPSFASANDLVNELTLAYESGHIIELKETKENRPSTDR